MYNNADTWSYIVLRSEGKAEIIIKMDNELSINDRCEK